jgi:hypothetical protein
MAEAEKHVIDYTSNWQKLLKLEEQVTQYTGQNVSIESGSQKKKKKIYI